MAVGRGILKSSGSRTCHLLFQRRIYVQFCHKNLGGHERLPSRPAKDSVITLSDDGKSVSTRVGDREKQFQLQCELFCQHPDRLQKLFRELKGDSSDISDKLSWDYLWKVMPWNPLDFTRQSHCDCRVLFCLKTERANLEAKPPSHQRRLRLAKTKSQIERA